jgi:hypothetical protein
VHCLYIISLKVEFPIEQTRQADSIGGLVVKLAVAKHSFECATSASPGFDSRPMQFLFAFCLRGCVRAMQDGEVDRFLEKTRAQR